MNHRNILSSAAAAILAVTLFGCSNSSASMDELEALRAENAQLRSQVKQLTAQLSNAQNATLEAWTLQANPWPDKNGATVTFSCNLVEEQEGQNVFLSVRLGDSEIILLPCLPENGQYTASVDLNTADGYGYTCILVNADGSRLSIPLTDPENPVNDTVVYLESSMSAYCNLMIADWYREDNLLWITSGYAQVQLPQITPGNQTVALESAQLVFQLDGNPISRQELVLPQGEGVGSYEAPLTELSFPIPEMGSDSQMELYLTVELSNGESIYTIGGSWFEVDGSLSISVG